MQQVWQMHEARNRVIVGLDLYLECNCGAVREGLTW